MAIELLLGSSGGSDEAFYPLVFFHVVSALAGFGSIGFAGVYSSRAAQLAVPEEQARVEAPLPFGEAVPATTRGARLAGLAEARTASRSALGGGDSSVDSSVDPELEELARYFARPARFWKAVLAVPVFGALALWVEPGGGGLDQVWDIAAMLVWAAAALVAAGLVAPSLRQVRSVLLSLGPAPGGPTGPEEPPGDVAATGAPEPGEAAVPLAGEHALAPSEPRVGDAAQRAKLARYGRLASRGAAACDVLFFVALAFMIWKP